MNRNIDANADGVNIQFSTDGTTWTTLGVVGDLNAGPNGWYNKAAVQTLAFGPGWDGNSNGWVKYEYLLSAFNNAPFLQFRFWFASNGFTQTDGVSIDDICVTLPSPLDASVISIVRPLGFCVAGDSCEARVVVRNYGTNNITSMDVGYIMNGTTPVVQAWVGNLAPSATDTVDLPKFISPTGPFTFCAYTDLPGDGNSFNDTLCLNPLPVGVPVVALNYIDNYDGANNGWTTSSPGLTFWQLGTPNFGTTNSPHSAPNAWDINLTSGYLPNANAVLLSPYFNFSNAINATMRFWQNRNTEAFWDGTRIDYSFNSVTWNVLGTVGDPLGVNWYTRPALNSSGLPGWDGNSTGWIMSEYNLQAFNSIPVVQFRFVFTSDASVQVDGQSIDDFSIKIPAPFDVGVTAIVAPTVEVDTGTVVPVVVTVKNFGTNPISSTDVAYRINNDPPVTITWNGPALVPNATVNVTLPTFIAPLGTIDICAWTELAADGDRTNDSICSQVTGVPIIPVTYCDDFDAIGSFWSHDGGFDQWGRGIPSGGVIDSAYTAPNAWVVNLGGIYQNNSNDFLYSPKFDFSGAVDAEIQIQHWINAEANSDGGRVEISDDGGVSWSTLGQGPIPADPRATNWYTNATLNSSGQPGWSGTSQGYEFSSYKLDQYNNLTTPIRFRFNFSSNGFTNNFDGWAIDNFCVYVPIPLTAAPDDIDANNPILLPGPQDVSVFLENRGTMDISDLWVTLNIDNNDIVTDSLRFLPPLKPGQRRKHFFTVQWQSTPGLHDVCVWTFNPNDQLDQDQSDDTTCVQLTVFDSTGVFPFCTDFEGGPQWVALNAISYKPQSTWEIGTPNQTIINAAASGSSAWMTGLSVNYPNRDSTALFSPVFNVKGNRCYKIGFQHIYDTEQFQDGGTVEYSSDNAQTWQVAGFGGEPNWMNSFYISSFGGPPIKAGWSGNSPGWVPAEYYLWFNNDASVIFRFRFASDQTVRQEGWAIDDFCFEWEQGPCIIGIDENENAPVMLWQNQPNPTYSNTSFDYNIPSDGQVSVVLTSVLGQTVQTLLDDNMPAGRHTIHVDTRDIEAGVYYYTLQYKDVKLVRKMVIIE